MTDPAEISNSSPRDLQPPSPRWLASVSGRIAVRNRFADAITARVDELGADCLGSPLTATTWLAKSALGYGALSATQRRHPALALGPVVAVKLGASFAAPSSP